MGWKEVDVKVILKSDNPVDFDLVPSVDLPKGEGKNDFIFRNEGHDGFLLNFILEPEDPDSPLAEYRFPDDKKMALFSAVGVECPTELGQWPQFKAKEVKPGNKILVVRNLNQKNHEGQFGYTLRLTKTPHMHDPKFIDLDPGGTNTNGSSRSTFENYVAMGTIAVTTGVLSAFATVLLARPLFCS